MMFRDPQVVSLILIVYYCNSGSVKVLSRLPEVIKDFKCKVPLWKRGFSLWPTSKGRQLVNCQCQVLNGKGAPGIHACISYVITTCASDLPE